VVGAEILLIAVLVLLLQASIPVRDPPNREEESWLNSDWLARDAHCARRSPRVRSRSELGPPRLLAMDTLHTA